MKPESKFWQIIKKNTPKIQWTRLESWASFGVPDLLGYHDNCGFFLVELKVTKTSKVHFSPHQKMFHLTRTKRNFILLRDASLGAIKLYESKSIIDLIRGIDKAVPIAVDDWELIQNKLIGIKNN